MMEFAPLYGGIVFAISNTVSNISGFLAPITTGLLLGDENEKSTIEQWQLGIYYSLELKQETYSNENLVKYFFGQYSQISVLVKYRITI